MRVGLVTCRVLPEPDPDAKPLADALRARGHTPIDVPWDDPGFDLLGFDLFVIRSCWNYFEDPDGFLNWIMRALQCTPIVNSAEVVAWNLHKSYLHRLAVAGIPIVETHILDGNGDINDGALRSVIDRFGDVVIKPAVAAGSVGVKRFDRGNALQAVDYALTLAQKGKDVMVQPYIGGFADPGERSLIWVDGQWTHAIRKNLRFSGQHERIDSADPPTSAELALAQAAIEQVPFPIYYARADMVMSDAGEPLLSELELMEPSLYFDHSAEALDRFVVMIEKQGGRRQ